MKKTYVTSMPNHIGAFLKASKCFSKLGINTHGLTKEQAEYNQYAPILMTSVDTDSKLCLEERKAINKRLGVGKWQIFGAHGFKKDYSVNL